MKAKDFLDMIESLCDKNLSFVIGNSGNSSFKAILSVDDFGDMIYTTGVNLLPVTKEFIINKIDNNAALISSIIVTSTLKNGIKEIYGFHLERSGNNFIYKTINPIRLFEVYNTNADNSIKLPKMNVVYCDIFGKMYSPFGLAKK
jgi:hypothetical protein